MKRALFGVAVLALLSIVGWAQGIGSTDGEMPAEDADSLISRELLFGNPDKITVRTCPDGSRISYLAPKDGVLNVWVGPIEDPEAAEPVTNDTYRGIRSYSWAHTNEHILYIQDKDGDENWRIYSVNLRSGEIKDLTPFEDVQARIVKVSRNFPEEIIVGLNDRDPEYHDLYRLNIETGKMTLIQENRYFSSFDIDDDYAVRFATNMTCEGGAEIFRPTGEGGWEVFLEIPMEDVITTGSIGFNKTGEILYFVDSRGQNTAALFAVNPATGEKTLIAEDPRSDFSGWMVHPTERNVQAAAFTYERKDWQVIDGSVAEDLAFLATVADGDVEVVSRSLDDRTWIVVYVVDDGPFRYYRYDSEKKEAEFLFTNRKDLEDPPFAKMMIPAVISSRDGLNLVSYYTLPIGSDRDEDGRPEEPLPVVLYVHGGPWARDVWDYNPAHQWLANRGYAVLSVNFRGSTGFGRDFVNRGNLEWGAKMHDDLIDAVDWAVAEGIADPDRVAIMGGSYGGYATLAGLTFTPEVFACGVDIVGPSNLTSLIETIPPYWQPQIELFATRMGDHRTEEGRRLLFERSPINRVENIARPLLIAQGANDPRVSQNESDQIVAAMQEKGIPVTYVLYPDEGHGFARPENRISFFAVAEAFLSEHLGGRFEPVGGAFENSTITVPVGAEEVPGLKEALSDRSA